jgi:hypothetical protein
MILRSHGHGNTASSQDHDRVRFPDSPELSPQFAFKCLDDRQPTSSSEDEPSDVTADESGSQGLKPPGFTAVTSLNERPADESDGDERRMPDELPNSRSRSSSWTDLDLSVIVVIITPFVNWLTGSDHLKNLFLVLFLIVYLQQLIQGTSLPSYLVSAILLIYLKFHGSFTTLRVGGGLTPRFSLCTCKRAMRPRSMSKRDGQQMSSEGTSSPISSSP